MNAAPVVTDSFVRKSGGDPSTIRRAIERFLDAAKKPVLAEPGEDYIALGGENVVLSERGASLLLQAWNAERNLVRRIVAVAADSRGRLELRFERFDKKSGTLALIDLERSGREGLERRASRLEFREQFRRFLRRQFGGFRLADLSAEANLEESLSPAYARAFLRDGGSGWAAIGAGPECQNVDGILSFGLIWLDYLRRRERGVVVRGLALLLPAGHEKTTCLRLCHMNRAMAEYVAFAYTEDGVECALDLGDYGNVDTRLEPVRRHVPGLVDELLSRLEANPAVESIALPGGELSLRVRGLEFARTAGGELRYGIETNRVAVASNLAEIEGLAGELSRLRSPDAGDKLTSLYSQRRECWLESQVRANLETIDARLLPAPVYGQISTLAGADRGIIDLLACDRDGRLTIIELKASEDIHLPLQALDYQIRVKWHLDRDELSAAGYFPGTQLRREAPRIILLAPALDFHPSNERVLRFLSPEIEIERIGVGAEWQRELKLMFRM